MSDLDEKSFVSSTSGLTQDSKKRRGLKTLGANIKNAFGGKGRRRRRKTKGDGDSIQGSSGSMSSQGEDHQAQLNSNHNNNNNHNNNHNNSPSSAEQQHQQQQQDWINSGGSGLAEMAAIGSSIGGRGNLLTKITEEDYDDMSGGGGIGIDSPNSNSKRRKSQRRGKRPGGTSASDSGSVSSSRSNRSGLFGRKSKKQTANTPTESAATPVSADPLSLVVLLVEPSSLRFELLSLEFDLSAASASARKVGGWRDRNRNRNRNKSSPKHHHPQQQLQLTVKDVLDQITPEALTDEKLKAKVGGSGANVSANATANATANTSPTSCLGLIDREGNMHGETALLENACAARPLRKVDAALGKNSVHSISNNHNNNDNDLWDKLHSSLGVPTYHGEPHRDVLLLFFGGDHTGNAKTTATSMNTDPDGSHQTLELEHGSDETKQAVAHALDLARPIFADPNVIGLMENSGYDLSGWKPANLGNTESSSSKLKLKQSVESGPSAVMLQKPRVSKHHSRKQNTTSMKQALLAVILATVLAWSLVSGGLHLLPSIASEDASNASAGASASASASAGASDGPFTMEGFAMMAYTSLTGFGTAEAEIRDQSPAHSPRAYPTGALYDAFVAIQEK